MATIGELTNVPQPGAGVASQWAQDATNRITHRFATVALMNGWAAADGSEAYCAETKQFYGRINGAWRALAQGASNTGWTDYVPISSISSGSVSRSGRWRVVGSVVHFYAFMSNIYNSDLPPAGGAYATIGLPTPPRQAGPLHLLLGRHDGALFAGYSIILSGTCGLWYQSSNGGLLTVATNQPFAWSGGSITLSGSYEPSDPSVTA